MIVSALSRLFLDENKNAKSIKTEEEQAAEEMKKVAFVADAASTEEEERNCFVMPLHYPNYSKKVYEEMEEWRLDNLLDAYGFSHLLLGGSYDLKSKKEFAMGAFLWPGSSGDDSDLLLHEKSGQPTGTTLLGFLCALLGF